MNDKKKRINHSPRHNSKLILSRLSSRASNWICIKSVKRTTKDKSHTLGISS